MKKKEVLVLPFSSTATIKGPNLYTEGGDLLLLMECNDHGQPHQICLRFVKQRAFRKRSEGYCTKWHVSDVFDTVCEVQESDWVSELRVASAPEWRNYWMMRHFMIYVDSFGCLEVIAETALLDD